MKFAKSLHVVCLFAVLLPALCACSSELRDGDEIDPAGGLTRGDYLALRHREENATPQSAAPVTIPPIPALAGGSMPAAAPHIGHDKLVSVTITEIMPLRDVLIELAREAKVNLELDPHVQGSIIFTAHDQPFDQVLRRICELADLRARADGPFIHIEMDNAYEKTYTLDYLSLSRKTVSETSIATNVFDVDVTNGTGTNGIATGNSSTSRNGSSIDNNSISHVTGTSEADFWGEVEKSLAQIIAMNGHGVPKDAKDVGATFSIDRQAGIITVFGDSRQQAAVDAYIRKLQRQAYAQVLIDARIIEVELDDGFQSGIDWSTFFKSALNVAANFNPATIATNGLFTATIDTSDFKGFVNFVRNFGTTRVLSSPRLTVMNNQTAVLKVATNQVYFVTQAQFTTVTNANGSAVTTTPVYTSTPLTVPVGFVMTVQPAIDPERGRVTLTLRPTISRVVSEVDDPSIGLNAAAAGVTTPVQSQIPVLAVREMDSVLQMHSGEIAIMGGLMQDSSINSDEGIPGADSVPLFGNLAKSRNNQGATTELVILLRATIADAVPPDAADIELYRHYNDDPRPLPKPMSDTIPPLPANPS